MRVAVSEQLILLGQKIRTLWPCATKVHTPQHRQAGISKEMAGRHSMMVIGAEKLRPRRR